MGKRIPVRQRALGSTAIRDDGCVEWTGGRFTDGYGRISVGNKGRRAHRVVYELLVGPIPDGLTLDHLCRNKLCCAPSHLEPVTSVENVLRGFSPAAQNVRKTHCGNGHPFDKANTHYLADGRRVCRRCAVRASQRYQAKHGRP